MAPLSEQNSSTRFPRGLVLGKFNPLTRGHQHLIETAQAQCRTLYISISGQPDEAIPQSTRAAWLRTLYPAAIVVENPQHLPNSPSTGADALVGRSSDRSHPPPQSTRHGKPASPAPIQTSTDSPAEEAFYRLWIPELQRVCGHRSPDALFTSESYGHATAARLHCRHIPVDPDRKTFPISATQVRQNPFAHWHFLHPIVRAHYVKTITLIGPESTGKTTLAQQLAAHFQTVCQPEWARAYLGNRHCTCDDMPIIATHHAAAHAALRPSANRILIQDTDALTTKIFSEAYYECCPDIVQQLANTAAQNTALYLLTDIDIPWQPDTSRDLGAPADRIRLRNMHLQELTHRNLSFTWIRGSPQQRLTTAIAAVRCAVLSP